MESRRSLRLEWMGWATSTMELWFARCLYSEPAASRGRGEDPQPCARAGVVPGARPGLDRTARYDDGIVCGPDL